MCLILIPDVTCLPRYTNVDEKPTDSLVIIHFAFWPSRLLYCIFINPYTMKISR